MCFGGRRRLAASVISAGGAFTVVLSGALWVLSATVMMAYPRKIKAPL